MKLLQLTNKEYFEGISSNTINNYDSILEISDAFAKNIVVYYLFMRLEYEIIYK